MVKIIWADGSQTRTALETDEGYRQVVPIDGKVTGNHGEWLALINALHWAEILLPPGEVEIRMDSQLIVNQFNGKYKVKQDKMTYLYTLARIASLDLLEGPGIAHRVVWVPREENRAGWLLEGK